MIQKYSTFYCDLLKKNIGDGICCLSCNKLVRPQQEDIQHDHQICKYERITGTFTREV